MSVAFAGCAAVAAAVSAWPATAIMQAAGPGTAVARARAAEAGWADSAPAGVRSRAIGGSCLLALLLAASAWGIAVRLHPAPVAAAACWLMICGIPLTAIDIRFRRLPNALTAASLAGVVSLLALAAATTNWRELADAVTGGLAVGGMFVLLALARPGSAGLGDAKLGLSTGALASWFGWAVLLASVMAAFALAAAYGLWLIAARRATVRGTTVPFGPFLLAGCLAVVLLAGVGHGHHIAALL